MIKKFKSWWKRNVCDTEEGYNSMFDEYFERDDNGNVKKRKTWTN